jgi:hypothetical protein
MGQTNSNCDVKKSDLGELISGNQIDEEKTLGLLRQVGASWKGAIGAMAATVVFLVFYFYGLNMVTYPWAYGLTSQTPQGNWIGKVNIDKNTTFLVNMKMAHDTEFSETKAKTIPSIAGLISICSAKTAPIDARIYGNPSWTGSTVVLGTKIDFGRNIVPEKILCKASKNSLECTFDFEHPISRASQKVREDFKNVYTPKAEFASKVVVPFSPIGAGDKSFGEQCKFKGTP